MKLYAVDISSVYPECEECVLVDENGDSTNRWEDGTAGVQPAYQAAAEDLFMPGDDRCVSEE